MVLTLRRGRGCRARRRGRATTPKKREHAPNTRQGAGLPGSTAGPGRRFARRQSDSGPDGNGNVSPAGLGSLSSILGMTLKEKNGDRLSLVTRKHRGLAL